jgi:hypothetical protein
MNTETVGHTPGPWLARESTSGNWMVSDDNFGETIAQVKEGANARLIAAAPELLVVLRDMVIGCEMHAIRLLGHDAARAAIAKAEGR